MNNAPKIDPAASGLPPEVLDCLDRIHHLARENRIEAWHAKRAKKTRQTSTGEQQPAWIERTTPND